uniref:uncharacterized protein C19orf44 homolog isoform X1 n=1 Tax=Monopterus albus TaxID=43700 RepID=UPI0009B38879|nr:uncharacterized protein C19orf44-like isoform X1 [Monopterus albus]
MVTTLESCKMWKRGGRSSALDRAQVLLSVKRSSGGVAESTRGSAAKTPVHTGTTGVSINIRSGPQNPHALFSDLSDLSSVSSAPEHGADTVGSAAPEKNQRRDKDSNKDLRPHSSLGRGGSRFLKKVPPAAINSSQSPVSKSQMEQMTEPRYASPSQHSSQTAVLNRLAQIESRIRSHKQPHEQARQGPKPAHTLTSELEISLPPEVVSQSMEASVPVSAQSSSDQSLKGKRFLKSKAAAASGSSKGPDAGVMFRPRAASAAVPLVGLKTKSMTAVSLESDEEDMRKLLGDLSDSTDNSFLRQEKLSSRKQPNKMMRKGSHKVCSTPPPAAVPPPSSSNSAPPHSSASPSHRSSPFRFTGQAQAHFSPSVLSPSTSPPSVSPSPPDTHNSPQRTGSPRRSLSSTPVFGEVLSLEELFPVGPASEDAHSEMSLVSSEEFKVNVMMLDDLVPVAVGFTEDTREKEREARHSPPVPGSPSRYQQLSRLKEEEQQQQEEEEEEEENVLHYQSDFESASQVSEHLQGDEEAAASEALDSTSQQKTEDDYSCTFSDTSISGTSQTSGHSQIARSFSRNRGSRSSVSHGSRTSPQQPRRRASARKVLREAAVQTQPGTLAYPWLTGEATSGPALYTTYMNPMPVAAYILSAETVEALSTYNPAVYVLTEMLKQQLAMTRQFIESSSHRHSSLVQSLGPPNYRYTTLEDTKEYIRKHQPLK